jgi:hypothetical protein
MNNLLAPHNRRGNMLTYLLVRAFLVNVEATLVHNSRDMGTISKCNINWPKIPVKYVIEYNEKQYRFPIAPNSVNRYSRRRKTLKHHTVTGSQRNHMRRKHLYWYLAKLMRVTKLSQFRREIPLMNDYKTREWSKLKKVYGLMLIVQF